MVCTVPLTRHAVGALAAVRPADVCCACLFAPCLLRARGLQNNQLTGALPDFAGFYALHILRMGSNRLSGVVPDTLAGAPWLTDLDLSFNQ